MPGNARCARADCPHARAVQTRRPRKPACSSRPSALTLVAMFARKASWRSRKRVTRASGQGGLARLLTSTPARSSSSSGTRTRPKWASRAKSANNSISRTAAPSARQRESSRPALDAAAGADVAAGAEADAVAGAEADVAAGAEADAAGEADVAPAPAPDAAPVAAAKASDAAAREPGVAPGVALPGESDARIMRAA